MKIVEFANSVDPDEVALNSLSTRNEIAEFANSLDLDEVAHHEPPHLDLLCLPTSLCILNTI